MTPAAAPPPPPASREFLAGDRAPASRRPALALLPTPRSAALRDGTHVELRALVPSDRALVAEAFDRLSPTSRYLRFLTPMPRLPKRALDALMDVDQDGHVALIALQDGRAIGVARVVRDGSDPHLGDLAITVIDERQGRGLGRTLLLALRDVAAERGICELNLDVHPENTRMKRLAASLGARLVLRDGLLSGRMPTVSSVSPAACAA